MYLAFKVPKNYSFVQAVDLFYKVHKLFHIPFHNHFQQTMAFLGAYVYENADDERFLTAKTMKFKHIVDEIQTSTINLGTQSVPLRDRL